MHVDENNPDPRMVNPWIISMKKIVSELYTAFASLLFPYWFCIASLGQFPYWQIAKILGD